MKKNAMLKIAAILMVAVLLTTCAISSTFAKYVTTGDAKTEVGRVALWDVEIVSSVDGLFGEKYENGAINASGNDVVSVATPVDNVVAPGTSNFANLTATLNGQPEVAFELTTVATVDLGSGWMVDLDGAGSGAAIFYCPLEVKVNDQATPIAMGYVYTDADGDEATVVDAATFAEAIKLAIETAATKEFAAGTELDDEVVSVKVEWSWDFDDDGAGTNDTKDTLLGEAGAATISITIQQTATQIKNKT